MAAKKKTADKPARLAAIPEGLPADVERAVRAAGAIALAKLTKAKLNDDVIITKIKSSSCRFDLSTGGLIGLKEAGVSDRVIQVMMETSTAAK